MSYYRDQLEKYLKRLDINAQRVIDIAGASNPVAKRVKSFVVDECDFLDNELEHAVTPVRWHVDMNLPLPESVTSKVEPYDLGFCLELMEYIWNPVQCLVNINYFLQPKAELFITFPFVYPMHQPIDFDYLRYAPAGVEKLLHETGFDIGHIEERIDRNNRLQMFYRDDGMHVGGKANLTGLIIQAIKL